MSNFEFPHTRTYDSDLGWLIRQVNSYDDVIKVLNDWIAENQPKIDDFEKLYEMLISGDLPLGVQEGIFKWCSENIADILGSIVKNVFFGLTQDGYFVAYIPDSWDDITFNTSEMDIFLPNVPEYGHLILSY